MFVQIYEFLVNFYQFPFCLAFFSLQLLKLAQRLHVPDFVLTVDQLIFNSQHEVFELDLLFVRFLAKQMRQFFQVNLNRILRQAYVTNVLVDPDLELKILRKTLDSHVRVPLTSDLEHFKLVVCAHFSQRVMTFAEIEALAFNLVDSKVKLTLMILLDQ